MSLVDILQSRKHLELKNKLRETFPSPFIKLEGQLKAPPLTKSYGMVGTAFDYLLRFYLQRQNKKKILNKDPWLADEAFKGLAGRLAVSPGVVLRTGYQHDQEISTEKLLKVLKKQYSKAKSNYKKYLSNGKMTNELIADSIFLAKLDVYFRIGLVEKDFDKHNREDIKNLKTLFALINSQHFKARKICFLNPTFGKGSALTMGADADLIIDNTLIEIKTTKHLKLTRLHLNQLLGYYVLSLIGGICENPRLKTIENIAVYFSRYGVLWTIPLSEFGNRNKFHEFKKWFMKYIDKKLFGSVNFSKNYLKVSNNRNKNKKKEKNNPVRKIQPFRSFETYYILD
jgi:hypothetical protein